MAYKSKEIKVLSLIDGIRKRPGMFIGDIKERGLFNLFKDVLFYLLSSKGVKTIEIKCLNTSEFEIKSSNLSNLNSNDDILDFFTKFDHSNDNLAMICLNALSEKFEIRNKNFILNFSNGIFKRSKSSIRKQSEKGIAIKLKLDKSIFGNQSLNTELLRNHLYRISFFFSSKKISFEDLLRKSSYSYVSSYGLNEYFGKLILPENPIFDPIYFSSKGKGMKIEIIFTYTYSSHLNIFSYVDKERSIEHGSHVNGFLLGLRDSLTKYISKSEKLNQVQIKKGLFALISIEIDQPQWAGSTKWKLINKEVAPFVRKVTQENLESIFSNNSKIINKLSSKASSYNLDWLN